MITPEGQLLDEAGALSLWNRRNELPPNERPWAEQQLRNYAGDRKAKNEHLWPSQEAQKAKANERMEARWLDGAETPGATPEAKDLYNEMAALSMFSGATGEQISYALPKYRSAVANALGSPGAETDPKQFRELLQVAIKTKRDKRVLIEGDPKTDPKRENSMGQHAWAAARDQVSEIDAYAKWSEKAKDKPGFDAQDNFDIFSKLQSAAKVKWDDYRSRAQMITSVLTDEMRQDTPSINVDGLLPLLSGLTAEERGSVLSLVKEDAMAKEKEVGQKTGETLARVGMRLGTAFTEMTDRGVANLSKFESGQWANVSSANDPQKLVEDQRARLYGAMTASMFGRPPALFEDQQQVQLTAEQAAAANKEVGKVKEQFRIVRELRDVATGKVDPAGSSNKAVDLLYYGSLNFVASMATFAIPGGMALNYNAYVNDEVNRLESLGVPSSEAMNQAMLVGAVQSGLDKFELSVFKRLPGLKNFKESMKAPPTDLAKALIGRVAGATAISVGESLAEGGQQMTPMVVQNMAAAIDKDRKTAEVRGLLKEGWTATYETFVSMLPLALMGLGIGGYGDFKGIQKLVSDKSALSKVGFSSEQISNIVAQPTPKGQAEFMASIWRERTPVHTAAITETQQKANDILQNPASTPGQISWAARASAGIEDHRVTEAAIFDALKEDAGGEDVSVVREKDGYLVNGKPAATANDAMGLLSAMAEERTQQWYSAVDEMVNKMVIGRTIEIKKGKSTLLDEILAAEEEGSDRKIETIWNRAQIATAAAGMPAIERDIENPATIETLNNLRVLGKSITEVKGNVLSSVSRILAGGGIIDLVEENAENDLRESILSGEVSMSAMKTALGKVEAATGIKFMENATDLGITEGWSKLVRLYVTGTKKEKTGFAAQAVRGDVAFKMKRIKQLMREESGKGTIDESLVSKLSAHMAYFKEILRNVRLVMKARESGALDDVESMIRKSIGLEDASIAEKTVAEIMVAQVESVTGESMSVSQFGGIDAEYMAAVESGNVEKQQEIVDAAAKAAGYNVGPVWHGTNSEEFTSFTHGDGQLFFFSPDKAYAAKYGERLIKAYLKITRGGKTRQELTALESIPAGRAQLWSKFAGDNALDGLVSEPAGGNQEIAVKNPNQIKSADPVVRDDQGNVIPPSQRFNPASDNISYSVSSLAGLDELINRIDERMASNIPAQNALWSKSAKILRDMERDLKTPRVTPDRYDDKGKLIPGRVIPALVEKRSASNIAKEAAFRAATDYDIRTSQELDAEQIVRRNAIFTKHPISKLKEDRAAYRTAVFEETFKGEASADETAWNHFQAVKDSILARSNISTEDAAYILGEPASEGAKALLSNIRSALKEANAKSKQLYDSSLATQKKKYEAAAKEAQDWRDAEEVKHRGPKNEALAWKKGTIALQKIQYSPMAQLLRDVRVMQAAIATLPKEVRGMLSSVYNVAILSSPAARQVKILDELEKANKEIERFLLKKFQKDVKGIFEAADEKKKSSGVITGTMTPDVQAYFTRAKTYAKMSREDVDKTMTALSDQLNQTNSTLESNEENTEKFIELMVFGAILGTGKNKPTAAEVYSAYEQLAFARKKGITAYAIKKTSIVEKISGMVASAIESLGKATLADAQEREARDKRQIRVLPGGVSELLRIYNIHDTLEVMFGENHPITKYFSAKIRHSRENARLEQYRETESLHNFIAENHGISSAGRQAIWLGKLSKPVKSPLKQGEGRKVTVDIIPLQAARNILDGTLKDSRYPGGSQAFSELRDMVDSAEEDQESITVEKVTFTGMRNLEISELEVVFYTMIWQQQRYKSNMENHGLGANFITQAEEWLSPEAKSIREYLRFKYSQEYDGMNAVYRNLFNVNMPQEDNYARASFDASGNTDLAVGPDGIPVMTGGSTVASIKGRVKHNAEPKRANALTMRLSHVGMISHWKATAELSRDMRSVFENNDVRNSIIKKFGKQRYATLMVAVGTLEAGGWKHAVGNTEGGEFIQKMMPIAVANGLGANIGSIMAQGSAALASAARIGATSYFKNLAKLAATPSVLVDVYKDFALQLRRGGQYSQGELLTMLTGENANVVAQTVMRVGEMATEALSVVDASLTTISGAVAYLHHLDTVKGMMGSEAAEKEYALDRMREVIEATAQPDDFARKSNFENKIARERGASAIALRTLFFFKSAQRGMAANIFKTAEQIRDGHITAKQGADRLAAILIIIPLIEQACRSAWKDLTSDEPDEKLWEDPTTWIMAILSAPVSGVPVIGIGFDFLKVQTIGGYTSTLQDPISRLFFEFPKSVKKMANGELDMQDLIGALHFVTLGTIISGKTGGALAESAVNLLSAWVGWDDGSVLTDGQKGEKYLKMMDDKRRRKDKKALRESRD